MASTKKTLFLVLAALFALSGTVGGGDRSSASRCPWTYHISPTADRGGGGSFSSSRLQFTGFSIRPPPGAGWTRIEQNESEQLPHYDVLFQKRVSANESVHAYAVAHRSDAGSKSPGEILRAAFNHLIGDNQPLKTFNDTLGGAECIGWEVTRAPSLGHRLLQEHMRSHQLGYLCAHPDDPSYLVEIGYFETTRESERRSLVPEEGGAFLKALRMTPLGVRVSQLAAGRGSRSVVFGRHAVWVSDEGRGVVSKLDPKSGAVLATIPVGEYPEGLAVGFGSVWVPNWKSDTVSRLDLTSNRVWSTIAVGRGPTDVAIGHGSVWITSEKDRTVSRLDPRTNRLVAVIHMPGKPVAITASGQAVWVEHFETNEIWRIDPKRNLLVATVCVGRGRHFISANSGAVWASNDQDDSVSRIDPRTNRVIATIPVGHGPMGIESSGRLVWVVNFGDSTVLRIDPRTDRITGEPIPIGENPFSLSANRYEVWVLSVWGHWRYTTVSRIDFRPQFSGLNK